MQKTKSSQPLALSLALLGALARFLPHPPNFAPVGAMSLFAGARISGWQAWVLPLALMAASDAVLGFSVATPFVYASFLITVWLGRRLASTESPLAIGAAAVAASVIFFLVTNFGHWMATSMYPHTASGLAACYIAALPFFGMTLAGDLVYTGVLFGLHAVLIRFIPERSLSPAQTAR